MYVPAVYVSVCASIYVLVSKHVPVSCVCLHSHMGISVCCRPLPGSAYVMWNQRKGHVHRAEERTRCPSTQAAGRAVQVTRGLHPYLWLSYQAQRDLRAPL